MKENQLRLSGSIYENNAISRNEAATEKYFNSISKGLQSVLKKFIRLNSDLLKLSLP